MSANARFPIGYTNLFKCIKDNACYWDLLTPLCRTNVSCGNIKLQSHYLMHLPQI